MIPETDYDYFEQQNEGRFALDFDKGKLQLEHIDNVELADLDYEDYPDFCDAYIENADYFGEPMTEDELNEINDNRDFIHECVFNQILS